MRRTPATDNNSTPHSPAVTASPRHDADGALAEATARVRDLLDAKARLGELSDDGVRDHLRLLRQLEGQVTVATARAVRELSARGATRGDGAASMAAWVRAHTGRSARASARMARLASTLHDLPATAAALSCGEVTAESADAIVQATRDGRLGSPQEVESILLPVARADGPEQVRAEVRRRSQQADGRSMLRDETRQHALRNVSMSRRDDGMWHVFGQLPGESGEKLRSLLDVFDQPDDPATPPERRRRPGQRLADALEAAIEVALAAGELPTTGGVARPHISVIVDVATLDTDLTCPDDPDRSVAPDDPRWAGLPGADTAWSGRLSPQAARRLCCDAGISRVVMAGTSQVLDVGRETRQWSAPQRRAIHARDRHCRGPHCDRPIGWTQIHHLQWWRHGGPTDLDNGLALCHTCHRLVHDVGWHAQLDVATAAVTWTSPDRRRTVVTHPRRPG